MMKINVMLDDGAYMPEKAHKSDAGYDIRTPKSFELYGGGHRVVNTGVHIEIPEGYVGMIKSKSGLNVNYNIITEGVIDAGYTGSIQVKMYNLGNYNKKFNAGDKITQLVIIPIADVEELIRVAYLEETERGDNGFGSTGK